MGISLKRIFAITAALASLYSSRMQAEGFQPKLTCSSLGRGYLTQRLKVDLIEQEVIAIELERSSRFSSTIGFDIQGDLTSKIKMFFRVDSCILKQNPSSRRNLIACSTGISHVVAEATLSDGSIKKIQLPDNWLIEAYQVDTSSVFESKTGSVLTVKLDQSKQGLGFKLSECK